MWRWLAECSLVWTASAVSSSTSTNSLAWDREAPTLRLLVMWSISYHAAEDGHPHGLVDIVTRRETEAGTLTRRSSSRSGGPLLIVSHISLDARPRFLDRDCIMSEMICRRDGRPDSCGPCKSQGPAATQSPRVARLPPRPPCKGRTQGAI